MPAFTSVAFADFQKGQVPKGLRFPVAVRSTYTTEDGAFTSQAGQFETRLQVKEEDLEEAIDAVFQRYPDQEGTEVLVQEMIQPDYRGVLFAFRRGSWKLEFTEGLGEALMSGQVSGDALLLPRFGIWDYRVSSVLNFWQGPQSGGKALRRARIYLSYAPAAQSGAWA